MLHIVSVLFFLAAGGAAFGSIVATLHAHSDAMVRALLRKQPATWTPALLPARVRVRRMEARPAPTMRAPLRAAA